jgi:hypothetical protein
MMNEKEVRVPLLRQTRLEFDDLQLDAELSSAVSEKAPISDDH